MKFVDAVRENLVTRVLSLIVAERGDETWANYDAHVGYCRDAVDEWAKELAVVLAAQEKQEEKL